MVAGEASRTQPKVVSQSPVDIVSDIDLTGEQFEAIADWLAVVDKERRPNASNPIGQMRQYVIAPHVKWHPPEDPLYRRFNCVGFVIECYKSAGISVIDTEAELPDVDLATLRKAYPGQLEKIELIKNDRVRQKLKEDLGIPGDGPWKIILPGYVFRSLERATPDTPRPPAYVPKELSEAHYPSDRSPVNR
ncbi:MAG: hypothetical protein M3552_10120 [Planctomycetota bacterium]|nr:hypothetical protein [Planctomycetota bacterium]